MIITLFFAIMSIPKIIATECEYPIFVRVKGRDDTFYLEVSSSGTVADLIHKMYNESMIPNTVDQDDLIINTPHDTLYGWGEDLSRSLADVAISAESVVSIDWLILGDLSDTQLLFHLFRDSRHTKVALGYATYDEFKIDYESFESQRQWLSDRSRMRVHVNPETFRIWTISVEPWYGYLELPEGIAIGTHVNWNVVSKLKALRSLRMQNAFLKGVISFTKLPETLQLLLLTENNFIEAQDPRNCTARLLFLGLMGNPLLRNLTEHDFPQIPQFEYFSGC